jgi:hypothetical protein
VIFHLIESPPQRNSIAHHPRSGRIVGLSRTVSFPVWAVWPTPVVQV